MVAGSCVVHLPLPTLPLWAGMRNNKFFTPPRAELLPVPFHSIAVEWPAYRQGKLFSGATALDG